MNTGIDSLTVTKFKQTFRMSVLFVSVLHFGKMKNCSCSVATKIQQKMPLAPWYYGFMVPGPSKSYHRVFFRMRPGVGLNYRALKNQKMFYNAPVIGGTFREAAGLRNCKSSWRSADVVLPWSLVGLHVGDPA